MEHVNQLQCPQCGSTTTTKISEGVYHCPYCESNFNVEVPKPDIFSTFAKASQQNQNEYAERVARLKAMTSPEALAKAKRTVRIIVTCVFAFILLIFAIVFFSVRGAMKNALHSAENGLVPNSTLSKFKVFAGSKGPAVWLLQEQSASMQDSTHYILTIMDPQSKKKLNELEFIKAMTWEDAFNSSKYIGELYPFGDTCWEVSDQFGLTARDIYSGKIIIDGEKLGTMYHDLSKGISKAEWGYSDQCFNLTTNDGFEFVFYPSTKKLIKKEDLDNQHDQNKVERTFFILTDGKRPALFESIEKTSPFATSSKVFNSELEDYKSGKRPWGLSDDVISVEPVLPDQTFFNGKVEYGDNDKAIIIYQNSIAKKSSLHVSCIGADGKENWNFSGNELKPFTNDFAENNSSIQFVYTKSAIVLFNEYGDHNAVGIDWNTGRVLWTYSPDQKNQ